MHSGDTPRFGADPRSLRQQAEQGDDTRMATQEWLDILAIMLVVAWLLGVASGYTWGGSLHLLVLLAVSALGIRMATSPRAK